MSTEPTAPPGGEHPETVTCSRCAMTVPGAAAHITPHGDALCAGCLAAIVQSAARALHDPQAPPAATPSQVPATRPDWRPAPTQSPSVPTPAGAGLPAFLDDEARYCPECFGQVPAGARRCMHCGASMVGGPNTRARLLGFGGAVVGLFAIFGFLLARAGRLVPNVLAIGGALGVCVVLYGWLLRRLAPEDRSETAGEGINRALLAGIVLLVLVIAAITMIGALSFLRLL